MFKYPEVMIIRYYEFDWMNITYSNDSSEENLNNLYQKLDSEKTNKNWLEYYEIIIKWEWIIEEN